MYEAAVFLKAFEVVLQSMVPQGMQLETIRATMNGQAAVRAMYGREEWARDFINCLPEDEEAQRLLMMHYLPVYVCRCNALHFDAGRCDECGEFREPYRMNSREAGKCGGTIKHFWQRVQERRLFGMGLRLVERG